MHPARSQALAGRLSDPTTSHSHPHLISQPPAPAHKSAASANPAAEENATVAAASACVDREQELLSSGVSLAVTTPVAHATVYSSVGTAPSDTTPAEGTPSTTSTAALVDVAARVAEPLPALALPHSSHSQARLGASLSLQIHADSDVAERKEADSAEAMSAAAPVATSARDVGVAAPSLSAASSASAASGISVPKPKVPHSNLDRRTIWSIVNPLYGYLAPVTVRMLAWWCVLTGVAVGLYFLETRIGVWAPIRDALLARIVWITALIFAVEPMLILLHAGLANYPARHPDRRDSAAAEASGAPASAAVAAVENLESGRPSVSAGAEHLSVVIVAHHSESEIEATLRALLVHVRPSQIFVIDNGDAPEPADATVQRVYAIHPNIHYFYQPIGSKLLAQYAGCRLSQSAHILLIDDDVHLPRNFHFATELFDDYTKGVAFALRAAHPSGHKPNVLVGWQDIEYKLSDLFKIPQSRYSTVMHPHGAVSLWERNTLEQVLRMHDAVFCYDDVQIGFLTKKLNKRIAMCADSEVTTLAPTSLIGTPPNLYTQRVRVWDTGRHAFVSFFVVSLLLHWDTSAWRGRSTGAADVLWRLLCCVGSNALLKLTTLYALYSLLMEFIRLPTLVIFAREWTFWALLFGYAILMVLLLSGWNWITLRGRTDLQSRLPPIATFPLHALLTSTLSTCGLLRTYLLYWPTRRHTLTVMDMERTNDPRALWRHCTPHAQP